MEVDVYNGIGLLVFWCTIEQFALRTSHETASPELNAVCLTTGIRLMAYTIDGNDRKSVGYCMTALNGCPSLALAFLFLWRVTALIADGGGINEQFCTLQGHQAGAFGIPLIPAHLYAQ